MSKLTRRAFVKTTAAASAAFSTFTIAGTKASGRVIGANETIRVGVVGLRGRGAYHVQMVSGVEGARVTALCDVDPAFVAREVKKAEGRHEKVHAFNDVRKLLDCKDVDAVSVATPNHWHWVYDYGNGDLGNQGIHEMDIARWFLGYETLSPRVRSVGGRLGYDDDGQTPNTQIVYHDYDGPPLIFEVRGLPKSKEYHQPATRGAWGANKSTAGGKLGSVTGIGVVVVCEGGRVVVQSGGQSILAVDSNGKAIKRLDKKDNRFSDAWAKGDHYNFRSWFKAIRSRNVADLTAEILKGHISSGLCHTGMISHRLGQVAPDGTILEQIKGDPLAVDRFEAFKDHLERNGVDLSKPHVTLGPWLKMDPMAERFVDNDAANALLTRDYRKPFAVPADV